MNSYADEKEVLSMKTIKSQYSVVVLTSFVLLFGLALHVKGNVNFKGLNISVSLSDLVMPLFAAWVFGCLVLKKFELPLPQKKYLFIWFTLMSCWLTFSLLWGYVQIGYWQSWALINKWLGWFVLIGYFCSGATLRLISPEWPIKFLKVFIIASWLSAAYGLIKYLLFYSGISYLGVVGQVFRITGFNDNPNAFGILMVVSIIIQLPFYEQKKLFHPVVSFVGLSLLCSVFYMVGSRSAYLGMIVGVFVLLILHQISLKTLISCILATVCIVFVVVNIPKAVGGDERTIYYPEKGSVQVQLKHYMLQREVISSDYGIRKRIEISKIAFSQWLDHPVIGNGLGTFIEKERKKEGNNVQAIHTTILWVLTEMGVGGVLLIAIFSIYVLRKSYIEWRKKDDLFALGVFGMLVVMAVASVGTEIMYQRYLWFILGLFLVVSDRETTE